ncbi:MAG: GTPase Era [Rhodospirillaceae bacterium]|nr:GTPase Era [Rhodospirillaceae bacterium]
MTQDLAPRCGFVAVLGPPNAGKSTLINRLVGTKVSIVSPKVQTTRTRVLGIALTGPAQVIFIDTPGIFAPKRRLDRAMIQAAWGGASDADRVALILDSQRGFDEEAVSIIAGLKERHQRADLVLNKIDLIRREKLLSLAEEASAQGIFDAVFMISAASGDGTDALLAHIAADLPEGPWHFPEDQVSDMPMRLLAAEVTREQIFLQLHQELPYAATVETEGWTEMEDGSVRIDQIIFVRKDSQKAIMLGKGGTRVKMIGERARKELAEMMERPVHLFLHVKVRENWQDERSVYRDLGLDYNV